LDLIQSLEKGCFAGTEELQSREELYFLFKWLFQEMLICLNLEKNSQLVRYLNFLIISKHEPLRAYLLHRIKTEDKASDNPIEWLQGLEESSDDQLVIEQSLIEKMLTVLQEDTHVNYDVLLLEQLKEFYLLQQEQATVAEQSFFLESQQPKPKFEPPQKLETVDSQRNPYDQRNPFRVRSGAEILPDENLETLNTARGLKMTIPKGILRHPHDLSNRDLHQSSIGVVLQCDTDRTDSVEEQQRQERMKAYRLRVLSKFLRADWDSLSDSQGLTQSQQFETDAKSSEKFLQSKVLREFPVFALNEDYLKCLAKVLYSKIDSI